MSDYDRYKSNRDTLDLMASQLHTMAEYETKASMAQLLTSAAIELGCAADYYTNLIKGHQRLKQQLEASIASEGE